MKLATKLISKLIELPLEKSNIGKICTQKIIYPLPLSERKKDTLTWLKVIGGGSEERACSICFQVPTALLNEVNG